MNISVRYMMGFILAFVGGFVDTATFVGARGVFSAHITGNFVLFAVAVFQGAKDIDYLKLLLFVPFVLTIAIVGRLSRTVAFKKRYEATMWAVAAMLLLATGIHFYGVTQPDESLWGPTSFFVMLAVIAMAIQNGLNKILSASEPMTTVMTGNVISFALEMIGYGSSSSTPETHKKKAGSLLRVIIGFGLGCLASAWMVVNHSMGALILPGLILGFLAIYRFTTLTDKEKGL